MPTLHHTTHLLYCAPGMRSALIRCRRENGAVTASGDLSFSAQHDYVRQGHSCKPTLVAGWRFSDETLNLESDRLGMIPLFIYQGDDEIIVSNDINRLASSIPSLELDGAALAVFLRLGYFIGADNPFAGVKTLAPGAAVRWPVESVDFTSARFSDQVEPLSRSEAKAQYRERFSAAVDARSHFDRDIILPLSGGRDSRHILLELISNDARPRNAVTVATSAEELRRARQLCSYHGIEHHAVDVQTAALLSIEIEKNRRTCWLSDEHIYGMHLEQYLSTQQGQIFDGIGGDILSNGLFYDATTLSLLRRASAEAVADHLLGKQDTLDWMQPQWHRLFSRERAVQRLAEEVAAHKNSPNPISSFYFWNRTRREIALVPFMLVPDRIAVSTPYLDLLLMDLFARLDADTFGAPGFHDEVIREAFPDSAGIPYATKAKGKPHTWDSMLLAARTMRFAVAANVHRLAPRTFTLPRVSRIFVSGNREKENWWLTRFIYLAQLLDSGMARVPQY